MLETLPSEAQRQAWVYGDWYAAAEGLVYPNFTQANLTDEEPDPDLPVEIAIDDGYYPDPRATLFIQYRPDHSALVFDELYEYRMLEEETITHIGEKLDGAGLRRPSLAAVSHEAVQLIARLRLAGIPARNWMGVKRPSGVRSMRLAAINLTRSLICDGKGKRQLFVHRRCRRLRDELTAGYKYPEGETSLSAMPADGNDHACNALESWVWYRLGGAAIAADAMVDFAEVEEA
jgi:hypothetical protein